MKSQEIRERFTNYFKQQGHKKLPSSSLIPQDDPTLLFANAGMNQFKDYFTGKAKPEHLRATSIQKCVRAGGKHNDLENVGLTARHHTFFEMLGNFSFGDYFKEDAIHFAWEFLTKELSIPKEKLYITVHHSDQQAENIWHKQEGVPLDRIFKKGDKDNFWEMGQYGPCGPCSEIYYDYGPQYATKGAPLKNAEDILDDEQQYVEIWNLVFMQFEKTPKGQLDLPRPSIDTGAGLERIATLMQGKYWNYDCDIFSEIIGGLEELSGQSYRGELTTSFRVVADHIRAATMLITDGVIPSNEGRGYVLRRIIRRAVRHLRKLTPQNAAFSQLSPIVLKKLGSEYPQNATHESLAKKFLDIEENKFLETLDSGMKFLENALNHHVRGNTLSGEIAFKLYDTYGFPKDLTQTILQEKNLKLDDKGFTAAMKIQKETSKKSWKGNELGQDKKKLFYDIKEQFGPTVFTGYETLSDQGKLLAKEKIENGYALVFNRTPFYGESGGQVGDYGTIFEGAVSLAKIIDTQKPIENLHVLYSQEGDHLEVGKTYTQTVEEDKRLATMKNHSATHLLQSALIEILGDHIKQAGSYVDSIRLRFDFTHPNALSKEEIQRIEKHVNNNIQAGYNVCSSIISKEKAIQKGAIAMFGEKYGEDVRVIQMGEASTELCGGTHVSNLHEIGLFSIINETSLSSGIRRLEAMTSTGAIRRLSQRSDILKQLEGELSANADDILQKLQGLRNQVKELRKENSKIQDKMQSLQSGQIFKDPQKCGDYLFKAVETPEGSDMKKLSDEFISQYPNGVLLLYGKRKDKLSALLRAHKNQKKVDCSQILKSALENIGGRGGGRPDMAQGSGDGGADIQKFVSSILKLIEKKSK